MPVFRNPRTGDVVTVPDCATDKYNTSPRWVRVATKRPKATAPTTNEDVDNARNN